MVLPDSLMKKVPHHHRHVFVGSLTLSLLVTSSLFLKPLFIKLLKGKTKKELEHLPEDTRQLMYKVGEFVSQFIATFPGKVIEANEEGLGGRPSDLVNAGFDQGWVRVPIIGVWLRKPLEFAREAKVALGNLYYVNIKKVDNNFGRMKLSKLLLLKVLRDTEAYPMEDHVHFLDSDEHGLKVLSDVHLAPKPGQAMPKSYYENITELVSDEAMTFIFFYGVGAPLMQPTKSEEDKALGAFVVDLDISHLEVREFFRRYGAKAYFDSNQNIVAIYDCFKKILVKPGDKAWEHSKCLLKQTMIFVITGREHLLWTHLLSANEVTRACENKLPPMHPIRRLLNVFTFRTNYINDSASKTLLPYASVFYRGAALTFKSFQALLDASVEASNIMEPFAEREFPSELKKLSDENKFPYISDGVAYFELVRTFVREWLSEAGQGAVMDGYAKEFYEKVAKSTVKQAYTMPQEMTYDALVNLICQHIFNATAFHELVGTVSTYTQFQSGCGLRIVDDATATDLQSFLIGAVITSLTGVRTPKLMSKFVGLFGENGAPAYERKVWDKFLVALGGQSAAVKESNKNRRFVCKTFDPDQLECSVSV